MTPGKVLKDRRSQRERGRMGTSVILRRASIRPQTRSVDVKFTMSTTARRHASTVAFASLNARISGMISSARASDASASVVSTTASATECVAPSGEEN